MPSARSILLPIFGAIAAIAAFKISAPFEATLSRNGLGIEDPRALFTYGTQWGAVNRIAFGSLVCGPFAMLLTLGRRSPLRVMAATLLGTVLGAAINFVADSGSDLIGIAISTRSQQLGGLCAMLAWCVLAPSGLCLAILLAIGPTPQRSARALFAIKVAALACLAIQIFGSGVAGVSGTDAGELLRSQIPVWRMVEIMAGVALGLTIGVAESWIRLASVRLVHGRNEFKDWSLDHAVSRIGSGEECEVCIRGYEGVASLHAAIVRQGGWFYVQPYEPTLVNGAPVGVVPLNNGDRISIGSATLLFSFRNVGVTATAPGPFAVAGPESHSRSRGQVAAFGTGHFYPPTSVSQAQPARLLFAKTGQEMRLPPGRYGVGREPDNVVCLQDDPGISRHHAELEVTALGLVLKDLGSTNGTRINGRKVSGSAPLKPGDVIEFGTAKFTYFR